MTPTRTWLALGALLAAIVGGTVWAAEQEKKAQKAYSQPTTGFEAGADCCKEECATKEKGCGANKCCTTEKGCGAGTCCAREKAKGCCADGSCCGCCARAKPVTVPATVNVMVAPPLPGFCPAPTLPDGSPGVVTIGPAPLAPPLPPAMEPPQPTQCVPVTRYVPVVPAPPVPQAACAPWHGGTNPWRVCVVEENGKARLGMQAGAGTDTSALCEGLVIKVGGDSLKLSVVGKQVQVSGQSLKATADGVCWSAGHGDIVLDGSVKLKYDADGHKAEITAGQVVVGVADGRIEVRGAGRLAVRQAVPAASGPVPVSLDYGFPVASPPSEPQQPFQPFGFWTGFFR